MLEPQKKPIQEHQQIVIVTGPSGAGRSTAINVLEDLRFEAIDNLPISLLQRLVEGPPSPRPLAVGIDVRNREFSALGLLELLDWMEGVAWADTQVLYVDANEDTLVRRFSETRRRHPLAPESSAIVGIRAEAELLTPVRDRAQMLIDTSDLTPHDLKAMLAEWFAPEGEAMMGVTVQSFSYKKGLPKGVDMVFDCRFLRNPYWDPSLRDKTGLDSEVQTYIAQDPRFEAFQEQVAALLLSLLPAFREEGKAHLSVGFGCTGGQHRSVALAQTIGQRLAEAGWQVSKRHREQERWAAGRPHRNGTAS